jgi:membrane protein DedA with SNARE-associated domain
MIQSLVDILLNLVQTAGLWGIGIAMFVESFFAPIPSEAIIPLGGFLVYEGKMQFWQVVLV